MKNTYIHKHPTKGKNSYYILNFNFSGFSGKKGTELEKEFNDKIYESIHKCIHKYHFDAHIDKNVSAARMLSRFISQLHTYLKEHKLYVIIDE